MKIGFYKDQFLRIYLYIITKRVNIMQEFLNQTIVTPFVEHYK